VKILQINTVVNTGSDGRIAEDIGRMLKSGGHQSFIGYGRSAINSGSELIKIGNRTGQALHLIRTRLFDRHGFGSSNATRNFIKKLEKLDPDLIHLHNIHGYYLNIALLFSYLKSCSKPVVWTLHDCWPFTGHCTHFEYHSCTKWKSQCFDCPNSRAYPKTVLLDNSRLNYIDKKKLFTAISNMTIVVPSRWLANHVRNSFLSKYEIRIINNGIDLDIFVPAGKVGIPEKYGLRMRYILGVANTWTERKGLSDFKALRKLLHPDIDILLTGLTPQQSKNLDPGIKSIPRTEDLSELAALYASASVYVNPTYSDNFPATNIEALACGTPVVAYNTGGCREIISINCGSVVPKGDIPGLHQAVMQVMGNDKDYYINQCRARAVENYDKRVRFADYLGLYRELT
jgi:putative colanic acid biosynthesis glycosyltransferase